MICPESGFLQPAPWAFIVCMETERAYVLAQRREWTRKRTKIFLTDKSVLGTVRFMNASTEISPRERIIKTALRLFYRQGYLATGINQIIAESNVAKATFYAHFPSKEVLCVAYLQARHGIWMQWLQERVEQHESAREKLFAIFTFLEEWMRDCEFRGCAFLNIASEIPAINSAIRNEVVAHKDCLQRYILKIIHTLLREEQVLFLPDSKRTADMVYVLVEGAIAASQNYNEVWPITAARETVERLLKDC